MNDEIELEWDEAKRQKTLKERDLDFELARYILADLNLVCRIDNRRDYKEARYIAYGTVHDQVFKLCYTMRGTVYRIISLHKINEKKQEQYYGKNSQNDCIGD
ncbi:MAG: BrnT family toxin [Spirochaetes bacterium]|nr:BrnT family toxin [Spirochaetota bacterium]